MQCVYKGNWMSIPNKQVLIRKWTNPHAYDCHPERIGEKFAHLRLCYDAAFSTPPIDGDPDSHYPAKHRITLDAQSKQIRRFQHLARLFGYTIVEYCADYIFHVVE